MYVIEVLISIKLTRTKPFHENRYVKTINCTALNIFFQHIHKNKRLYFGFFGFFLSLLLVTKLKTFFAVWKRRVHVHLQCVHFYQKNGNSMLQSVKCRANPFPICDWFLITQFRQCHLFHLICRTKNDPKNLMSNPHKNL